MNAVGGELAAQGRRLTVLPLDDAYEPERARIHTPRLNEFLRETAALVARARGAWRVDLDETSTDAARWTDERGTDLLAAPPALHPPEAYDDVWF